MSGPPRHVRWFRVGLVVAVLVVLAATAWALPWSELADALDPWVDAPRRAVLG